MTRRQLVALESGKLSSPALDVSDNEPLSDSIF